jgi:hypothetical protein
LTEVLSAPGIFTGLNGINSVNDFLNSASAQAGAMSDLLKQGFDSLTASGVITPPVTASISALKGQIYTQSGLLSLSQLSASTGLSFDISSLTSGLPSLSSLTTGLPSLGSLTAGLPNFSSLSKLTDLLGSGASGILGGVSDSLVAATQPAAGFSNTVNRATVDVATAKIFGSNKIPVPSLGANLPDSSSIAAALDIGRAQTILKDLQGQGSRLLGGVQSAIGSSLGGITSQVTALSGSVQQQATTLARSATTVFNPATGTVI